uniref:p46 n=1 Tax=Pineapple mealybug wilt-associated virus 1 TaxID=180903 RepID=A0A4D6G089_9CLOS|nr:p46 [Pineapple mealybug wilt-associated virus 1]QJQ80373.1 p61 [Pineapple mealybug wilt-associated virus 1]
MALKASSVYVTAKVDDSGFLDLLRTFYGKSDVAFEAAEIFNYLRRNFTLISGRFVVGTYVANTWWQMSGSELTAWPDSEGWARHLLGNFIVSRNLLGHLYYPLATEIRAALASPDTLLREKLALVDVPVTRSSNFAYKVTRGMAQNFARSLPGEERHLTDLIFCVGNYLGKLPSRDQILGEVSLPIAAVRNVGSVINVSDADLFNENKLALLNMLAKSKMADPVDGVKFVLEKQKIDDMCQLLFKPEDVPLCSSLPAIRYTILKTLDATDSSTSTFEDRVETSVVVGVKVRQELKGLLRFKEEEDLNTLLAKTAIKSGEMVRGDAVVIQNRYEENLMGRTLMRVASPFTQAQYSDLTARIVREFLTDNLHVDFNFAEAILIILQRYIHYRTNPVRFTNLPTKLEIVHKHKTYVVNYAGVDRVFAGYQNAIPDVERAWCAPLATVAYFVLRDTGGSYAKWRDMMDIPPALNFDFVGFMDPRVLPEHENVHLARLTHRFKTAATPVRGFKLGNRLVNPIDHMYDQLPLPETVKENHKALLMRTR